MLHGTGLPLRRRFAVSAMLSEMSCGISAINRVFAQTEISGWNCWNSGRFTRNFFRVPKRSQWVPKLETDPKLETARGELRFKTNHE